MSQFWLEVTLYPGRRKFKDLAMGPETARQTFTSWLKPPGWPERGIRWFLLLMDQGKTQSRHTFPTLIYNYLHKYRDKGDARALMLRTAFAAQRVDRNNSEGTYSFDSSVLDGFGEEENTFQSTEDFLLELGFGGPSLGLERVPERFLQSSQVSFFKIYIF